MSKYQPLSERLSGHPHDEWKASFSDIEEVLGFPLPKSAQSPSWWSNEGEKPHAKAWTGPGWQADVDPEQGAVTFRRGAISPAAVAAAAGLAPVGDLSEAKPPEVELPRPPSADLVPETGPTGTPQATARRPNVPHLVGVGALVAGSVALMAGLGALAMRQFNARR